jgi:hypothetical protein
MLKFGKTLWINQNLRISITFNFFKPEPDEKSQISEIIE